MPETVKTIISNKYISFLMSTEGDYICCTLPRYDTYLFSQAMKEAIDKSCSINFETNSMSVDILNLNGTFIIDCTHKVSAVGFQITCINGIGIAEALETAAIKGNKEFGNPLEERSKWGTFKTLADPA